MSAEVNGKLVNFYVRDQGVSTWRKVVCLENSSFSITAEVSKRKTNCGIKSSQSDPDFSCSGSAVQNAEPTSQECSYAYIKERMKNKVVQEFKYQSDADVAEGLSEGEGIYNYGDGRFTQLDWESSAEGEPSTYSFTFEGEGILDIHESP